MGHRDREVERQAQILRYWRAVEYFTPPKVAKVDPQVNMRSVRDGRPLPWEPGGPLGRPKPNRVWQHTVYLGVFPKRKITEVLHAVLRSPQEEREADLDRRDDSSSALLSMSVDADGFLIKDSATISTCAWAVGRTVGVGPADPGWLAGFEQDRDAVLDRIFDIGDGQLPIVTGPAAGPSALGPVAGIVAKVVLDAATGGIASLAGAVGDVLGPVAGPIAGKAVETIGDALAEKAVDKAREAIVGDDGKDTDASKNSDGDGSASEDEQADADDEPTSEIGTKVLTLYDLAAATDMLAEALGVAETLIPNTVRVKSYQVPIKHAEENRGEEFLNSFYADDLERVARALEAGQAGEALHSYLRADAAIDVAARIDVRRAPSVLLQALAPVTMPPGRWPGKPHEPLTLSQQFAVNQILRGLDDPQAPAIYAVNGPPGTGKTTMLRDLVAGIVVARAIQLATLKRPRDAFGTKPFKWRTEDTPDGKTIYRSLYPLNETLTGFEMVVASSNNGAVENVSMEIPGTKGIDLSTFPGADYLGPSARLAAPDGDAWGAVAARLGRRSFRSDFVKRFWWGNDAGKDAKNALHTVLKNSEDTVPADPAAYWAEAVAAFLGALNEVEELALDRQEIADLIEETIGPDPLLRDLRRKAADSTSYLAQLGELRQQTEASLAADVAAVQAARGQVVDARSALESTEQQVLIELRHVNSAETLLRAHDTERPGRLRRLLFGSGTWAAEHQPYLNGLAAADAQLRDVERARERRRAVLTDRQRSWDDASQTARDRQTRLDRITAEVGAATARRTAAEADVRARQAQIATDRAAVERARAAWSGHVPGPEWDADPGDDQATAIREQSAPWMDPNFVVARSRLFLAALDLHQAVMVCEPELVRKNLLAATGVVRGEDTVGLTPEAVLAAWQQFFFVVPVVSTTFASLARMFADLSSESLGWLFIDEAGQAAPQEAVGALWRTRRAVVVGDPRQLEPVFTLPWSGQKRLSRRFEVDPVWTPQGASVQTVADRLNRYGTWLSGPGGDLDAQAWVGSPLRVHRRCDRLMFEVSNRIAYDDMMVNGVRRTDEFPLLGGSRWLDVPAPPGKVKWNPVEGRYAVKTLDLIAGRIREQMEKELAEAASGQIPKWAGDQQKAGAEARRRLTQAVFVVSPFQDVVRPLATMIGDQLDRRAKRVGTVHTTQGKEADIVLLVLGTGADQGGSRDWAGKAPNLLNVAVTRAKRCLIVIGDHDRWAGHSSFDQLAAQSSGDPAMLPRIDVAKDWPL